VKDLLETRLIYVATVTPTSFSVSEPPYWAQALLTNDRLRLGCSLANKANNDHTSGHISHMTENKTYLRILTVVRRVPYGRVATYGMVAELAGFPGHPRLAGYALRHADESVPWHRIVNARGEISPRAQSDSVHLQRKLLENEGIRFNESGRIDLDRYRWRPRTGRRAR
jgi:methylated-DNA-protein-cysteine methyltransferase-like protein